MTGTEKELKLHHSTAFFRTFDGQPEMLLVHGCDGGAAYIIGAQELEAVAEQIRLLLQHNANVSWSPLASDPLDAQVGQPEEP